MKRKKRIKDKKADLTMKTLVTVILLVIGFAIIIFVYYQLKWTGRVDREVCHQSLIYRATLPSFAGVREYVPLKCKTQKVCVTTGFLGGECGEFKNEEGITKLKVKNKEQIEQFIAQDIVDCWSMMGEGKVEIFGSWLAEYGIGGIGSSCVICSRIAFNKTRLIEKGISLEEIDVMNYMMTHKIPDRDVSYYDYLSKQYGKMSVNLGEESISIVDIEDVKVDENGIITDFQGYNNVEETKIGISSQEEEKKEIDEIGVMFMQISAPSNSDVFRNTINALAGGFGGSFVLAPHITTASLKSPYTWAILAVFGIYQQGNTLSNRAIASGYCGDVSIGKERDACSVVRLIDYSKEDISRYCSIVESIP